MRWTSPSGEGKSRGPDIRSAGACCRDSEGRASTGGREIKLGREDSLEHFARGRNENR